MRELLEHLNLFARFGMGFVSLAILLLQLRPKVHLTTPPHADGISVGQKLPCYGTSLMTICLPSHRCFASFAIPDIPLPSSFTISN